MAEIELKAKWDEKEHGKKNKEWIRFYIFLKRVGINEYSQYNELFFSVKEIVKKLDQARTLKSFHFLNEPLPKELRNGPLYWSALDVRIWIKIEKDITERNEESVQIIRENVKEIIKKDLATKNDLADFAFWHFPQKHPQYCSDSKLYYEIICKVYELFCRYLFEKLDSGSSKSILYEKLEYGNSRNILFEELNLDNHQKIEYGDFSNWKIIHCFLNSQGMNPLLEAYFGIFYALERLSKMEEDSSNLQFEKVKLKLYDAIGELNCFTIPQVVDQRNSAEELIKKSWFSDFRNQFWYFPLQIEGKSIEEDKIVLEVSGQWKEKE